MIYRCTERDCEFIAQQQHRPDCCPRCGGMVRAVKEKEMTGQDWTLLGLYWLKKLAGESRAVACFQKAAMEGDAWGICNLGWCNEKGIGLPADPKDALWLYEQAAGMGYAPAWCNLGVCYQEGIGTQVDRKKAIEYFTAAARHNCARAQVLLASCYENGLGVARDLEKAAEWLLAAAWQGR